MSRQPIPTAPLPLLDSSHGRCSALPHDRKRQKSTDIGKQTQDPSANAPLSLALRFSALSPSLVPSHIIASLPRNCVPSNSSVSTCIYSSLDLSFHVQLDHGSTPHCANVCKYAVVAVGVTTNASKQEATRILGIYVPTLASLALVASLVSVSV